MTNLVDFEISSTLDNMMFYLCSLNFDSIEEYIGEVYEDNEEQFRDVIRAELNVADYPDNGVAEIFQTAIDWFEYKKLLTWRGIEDQDIIREESSMLVIKNEKCKVWVVVDSEGGGIVVLKDTCIEYDDRDDYSNEYSDKYLETDLIKTYTYEELYKGVDIESGCNVWIGNDLATDGALGLSLVFRKI